MSRMPRSCLPDGYFHVVARGIATRPIFLDTEDRETFLDLVALCERLHGWSCDALCVMTTHYHLVLESRRVDLSDGIHRLNWRYARHFNRRHERYGHVFAERFSTRVIEGEQYLFEACAYVVLNPVRAGLCDQPDEWPWSYSRYGLEAA